MLLETLLLILTVTFPSATTATATNSSCVNVVTSKGLRTLQHSQVACAPVQPGKPWRNEGLQYLTCDFGKVSTGICPNDKRYDVAIGACIEPHLASCELYPHNATTTRRKGNANNGGCKNNCRLPDCFCFGSKPKTRPLDTPMFVMITFDDFVNNDLYNKFYKPLFIDNIHELYNPNGCPIKMGLFVSLNNTNVTLVEEAYEAGHEIGSHTVNHGVPEGANQTYAAVVDAIVGMKQRILKMTGNKALHDSIVGFRTPYLKCVGDIKLDVLRDHGFLYDSSYTNTDMLGGVAPHWPFTLDFFAKRCVNCPCPEKRYPGLWEVPLNAWLGEDGHVCSMVDGWTYDDYGTKVDSATAEQWYNYYNRHFLKYLRPHKVPMSFFSHGHVFFKSPSSFVALGQWLKDLLQKYPDVWIVPPKWVIEWMKRPLTVSEMIAKKWGC
ncbi:unnamed protein product [Lymnaea stagnalis]|uniref:NodB homology domain-containing protein n=1 Tax=Lymnaea stagnalis TaxID=6523 RepID=A0AAV2HS88_LYMST